MDHHVIEASGLVERYLLGQAMPEEKDAFEDHYLDCAECLERLELARRLRHGLAQVAMEEAARASVTSVTRQLGAVAALARLVAASRRAGLLVTALLVAALVPAGVMWRQTVHLGRDLEETRSALEETRRTAPPPELVSELAAARQTLAEERARGEREKETARGEHRRLAEELAEVRRPQANTAILSLSPERSGPGQGEPSTRITLSPSPESIVLSLDLPPLDQEGPWRAILLRGGKRLWQGDLEPGPSATLAISFPAGFLEPGDYLLELETVPRAGRPAPLSTFRFRVRAAR